jgi:hypothetical protein
MLKGGKFFVISPNYAELAVLLYDFPPVIEKALVAKLHKGYIVALFDLCALDAVQYVRVAELVDGQIVVANRLRLRVVALLVAVAVIDTVVTVFHNGKSFLKVSRYSISFLKIGVSLLLGKLFIYFVSSSIRLKILSPFGNSPIFIALAPFLWGIFLLP